MSGECELMTSMLPAECGVPRRRPGSVITLTVGAAAVAAREKRDKGERSGSRVQAFDEEGALILKIK